MAVDISIVEGQGYINGVPDTVTDALRLATSFRPEGYQYTAAFKRGRGDGWIRLLKHNKFPAGLVGRVTKVLDNAGIEYTITMERKPDEQEPVPLNIEAVGIDKRTYQDDAVERTIHNLRGIIRAPTGAGKTAIGARIVAIKGVPALIVVPTIDLLHQYRAFLGEHLVDATTGEPVEIGQLGDGVVNPQPVTVATVRTAAAAAGVAYEKYEYAEYDDSDPTKVNRRDLRDWWRRIRLLIVDEAHILGAKTVFEVANAVPTVNKYGMSASPWRDDGADLMIEAATGPPIYTIPTKILVDAGYLVPVVIREVNTRGWWQAKAWGQTCSKCKRQRPKVKGRPAMRCECGATTWRSEFPDAYREEIVENPIRNQGIAHEVAKLSGPTLVLVKQVKHGRLLEDLIPHSVFISGKDPGSERARYFAMARDGELPTLIATTIADMGLDIPILQNLVLAGGGKSSTRHLQRLGRVVRPYPGKDHATCIDFNDGHVHAWFENHCKARRKIEHAEWAESALWL